MTILALDTASDLASVAVRRNGELRAELSVRAQDGHSHLIFEAIRKALAEAQVAVSNVDCFAAAKGPGSFTGVRLALAIVKGFAEALHKPVYGVSNLRALAWFGSTDLRSPMIDARRGQIYAAVYSRNGEVMVPEQLTTVDDWAPGAGVERVEGQVALAPAVAAWAEVDGEARWTDAALLDAHYVRRSDAELFWTDINK